MTVSRQAGDMVAEKYRLDVKIGEGGFGVVWRGTQLGVERPVAIKFVKKNVTDDETLRRFRREARALATMQHPGCVTLIDFGADPELFLVTEFVEGQELDAWSDTPRSMEEKLAVCRGLLDALAYAHREGIVHRDLKPANIFVCEGFDGWKVKVLDFGIASVVGAKRGSITKTGDVFGTPGYMSIEQMRGQPTGPPSDLYSCGVIFYELFENRPLFESDNSMQLMMKHMVDTPPRLTVDQRLADFVARCLQKEPAHRFSSATEALHALSRATAPAVPAAPPAQPAPEVNAEPRSGSRPLHVWGLVILLVVSSVIVLLVTPGEEGPNGLESYARLGADVVYLPPGYTSAGRYPLLVVHRPPLRDTPRTLEDHAFEPVVEELMDGLLRLRAFADGNGWIVWVRNGDPSLPAFQELQRQFRVDPERVTVAAIDPTDVWHEHSSKWGPFVRGAILVFLPQLGLSSNPNAIPSFALLPYEERPESVVLPKDFVPSLRTADALCVHGMGCLTYPGEGSPMTVAVEQFERSLEHEAPGAAAPAAGEPRYLSDGCGTRLEDGLQRFAASNVWEADVDIFVPEGVDTSRPHPLIVLPGRRARWPGMSGASARPADLRALFEQHGIAEVATSMGAVVVFSTTDTFDASHRIAVERATCFDSKQVFAIGFPPPEEELPRPWPFWDSLPVRALAVVGTDAPDLQISTRRFDESAGDFEQAVVAYFQHSPRPER